MATITKPSPLVVIVKNIPAELRDRAQWVSWLYEPKKDKPAEWTKPPYISRTSQRTKASSTDPTTWSTFEQACVALPRFDGLGYVLTEDDPHCGLDLDHCRDPQTGVIPPWAREIVDRFRTYTEVSPSGTGVRLFFRGRLPDRGRKRGPTEVYDRGRYLTVTGHHLVGTPTALADRQTTLDGFLASDFADPAPGTPTNGHFPCAGDDGDDVALLERARHAKFGDRFRLLFDAGDWQGAGYPSHSEGDLALCHDLVFWTNRDPARVDRLFRGSKLMRTKWDSRHGVQTYGAMTIATAMARCSEGYTAGGRHRDNVGVPVVTVDPDVLRDASPPDTGTTPRAPYIVVAPAAGFIARYVTAAQQRTDAPAEAHELAAVLVLSALAGSRVRLPLAYRADGVRLVLWGMNVVDSTSGRKTTVNEFAVDVIRQVLGDTAILPWKGSPEAFVQALAARDGQAAVFARDEYTGLLASMKKGGYTAGLAQDFIRAYDGLPITMARTAKMNRKTGERVDDTDRVRDPYLVKLCAATRTSFTETATVDDVLDGLLARFVFTSGTAEERRPQMMTPTIEDAWREVVALARGFHQRAGGLVRVTIPEPVLDLSWTLEKRYKRDALKAPRPDAARPAMKRLAETVLKVAALLAIDRTTTGPAVIDSSDFDAAAQMAAHWQTTTLGIIAEVGRTRFQARSDAVLNTIRNHPKGIMLSSLYRVHRDLNKREFDELLAALETQRFAHPVEAKTGRPGRAPIVYFPGPPTV